MEMTQEWITQFNKKCAEFVGEEITTYFVESQMDLIGSNALQFHSDWNWIMEVIQEIIKIPDGIGYQFKRSIEGCFDSKEEVIQAIDQFIDWYNKQKES